MPTPDLSPAERSRYSRHIILPQVGLEGQQKLKAARVLIVGTGGLGSPVSLYLAGAGVGHIGLVDFDTVDETNLGRQIVHGESTLGFPKVESAAKRLADLNSHISIHTYYTPLTRDNALDIVSNYDVIVDGTDNFPSRYLLNDAAVMLGKPLVYGSIYRFEGQVSVFATKEGPCYRCLLPTPPPPHLVPSCAEAGVFGVLPGTIGTIQATEVIKIITGIGQPLIGRLLLYDALDMTFDLITLPKRLTCPVCGEKPTITTLIDYEEFCGMPTLGEAKIPEWSVEEIKTRLDRGEKLVLVDVREPYELTISHLENAIHIPMSQIQARWQEIPHDVPTVIFCRGGVRSANVIAQLQTMGGYTNLINMGGGINEWARKNDPTLPLY